MNRLNFKVISHFASFTSKSLVEIAKINLELSKILPMTEIMKQSARNRNETSLYLYFYIF